MKLLHNPRGLKAAAAAGLSLLAVLVVAGAALAQPGDPAGAGAAPEYAKWTFRAFALLTILGACATVVMPNPVVAAMCLVGTLFCTGGIYLVMHATFMAAIQVLVYAGAIMVLFIFVVMSVGQTENERVFGNRSIASKITGALAVGLLIFVISPLFKGPTVPKMREVAQDFGNVEMIGGLLFDKYLFPFEALSVLLLAAIVGAVLVTRTPGRRSRVDGATPAEAHHHEEG
jgi:NADH-quinone oxidoreductase subunit J